MNAGGWAPHPETIVPADVSAQAPLDAADRAASVVRMGARCRLAAERPEVDAFIVSEFLELATGRLVLLHEVRGVTLGTVRGGSGGLTADNVVDAVLAATLPDDDDAGEHPWGWLAGLARDRGLAVSAPELATVPYDVVLGGDVVRRLRSAR